MTLETLINTVIWTRTRPTLFNPCWYTLSSIRKFIEDSVSEFREKNLGASQLKVLDFWCGNQPYRYVFSNDEYYWCDIWTSPERNGNMTVIAEWEKLPYEDNQFDILLCTEVMEHLKYPELYASEFARIIKPGGLLLITVPQIWNYHPYPQHFFLYTPDGLNLFLKDRFSSVEMFSDTKPFQTWMMIAMMYSNWKIHYFKAPYIFLTNLLFLAFPKYQKYNHAASHIFARYIK